MKTENVYFTNNLDQRISGRLHWKHSAGERPGIIFCHGLFSTKDGYKITRLAEPIVESGFTLLTFDFSFMGESGGDISELSVLQEVNDLHSAYGFLRGKNIETMHLAGSSMGGVVSLLYSARRPAGLKSITLIATPVLVENLMVLISGTGDISSLPEKEFTLIDGRRIPNSFFLEASRINMYDILNAIAAPALIIHGEKDAVVPHDNALWLHEKLNVPKKLITIDDGDHNLVNDHEVNIIRDQLIEWIGRWK